MARSKKQPVIETDLTPEEAIQKSSDFGEFVRLIGDGTQFSIYRNSLADEWRQIYLKPLEQPDTPDHKYFYSHLNLFSLESEMLYRLRRYFPLTCDPDDLSLAQMCAIVNGLKWSEAYREYLNHSLESYVFLRYEELRSQHEPEV